MPRSMANFRPETIKSQVETTDVFDNIVIEINPRCTLTNR